jgi:hypothetical protein
MPLWSFTAAVPAERQRMLLECDSFDTIELSINLVAKVESFIWEPASARELAGCSRASYKLTVVPELYDLFFNSPVGYRAQYAASVNGGETANHRFIETLTNKLLAASFQACSESRLRTSLQARQAKVWIHEKEVESHLGGDEEEIFFPQWRGRCETDVGLRAPVGTELVIHGGWLDSSGIEKLNPFKLLRSKQIHECGFS